MVRIQCELCGSSDLIKDDGMFVCQHCGCKYTLEEAKKLMIEGTVKIDNSEELANLYILARRAKDENNYDKASDFYRQILLMNPNSWEANFYSTYYNAMQCTIGEISFSAGMVDNCLRNVLTLLKDSENIERQKEVCLELTSACSRMCRQFLKASYNHWYDFQNVDGSLSELKDRCKSVVPVMLHLGELIFSVNELDQEAIATLEEGINVSKSIKVYEANMQADDMKRKIKWIKNEAILLKERKKKEYWESHPEERKQLENDIDNAEIEIRKLLEEKNSIPEMMTINDLLQQIEVNKAEMKKLGLFKHQEKKPFKDNIKNLENDIRILKDRIKPDVDRIDKEIIDKNHYIESIKEKL